MRWLAAGAITLAIWLAAGPVAAEGPFGRAAFAGPAWQAGPLPGPVRGGVAWVASASGADEIALTCTRDGPVRFALRSARLEPGEVQIVVDGRGVEWLDLRIDGGTLAAPLPRGTGLAAALQAGDRVEVIDRTGRVAAFGLRGSARAIAQAIGLCR